MFGLISVLKTALLGRKSPAHQKKQHVVIGRYNISGRRDLRTKERQFLLCRAERVTAHGMRLIAPVIGEIGEPVTVQFDSFGELTGSISKVMQHGFNFSIKANDAERAQLAAKIEWFEKRLRDEVSDIREHGRVVPREPLSTLIFADGSTVRCLVVDMSRSGVAVSAGHVPDLGTPLAIGKLVGRVVRHFAGGFAIEFIESQDLERVERLAIKPLAEPSPMRQLLRRR